MQLIHRILERLAMATIHRPAMCDASMCGPQRRTAARRLRLKPSACATRTVWGLWRHRSRRGATRQRARAPPHRRGRLRLPLLLAGARRARAHTRQRLAGAKSARCRAWMRLSCARQAIVGRGHALTVARTARVERSHPSCVRLGPRLLALGRRSQWDTAHRAFVRLDVEKHPHGWMSRLIARISAFHRISE